MSEQVRNLLACPSATRPGSAARRREDPRTLGRRAAEFIKSLPHEYKRVLGITRAEAVYAPPLLRRSRGGNRRGAAWRKVTGFLEIDASRPTPQADERIKDWFRNLRSRSLKRRQREQGARCMDVRRALLASPGCPGQQSSIPRIGRSSVPTATAGKAAIRPPPSTTTFPSSPARYLPRSL